MLVSLLASGCADATSDSTGPTGPPPGAIPAALPSDCTARVNDAVALRHALESLTPGARLCVTGQLGGARLTIWRSGTPQQPIEVFGDGHTTVAGITINADQVAVRGFTIARATPPEFG
jgi:hypothetical protein